MLREAFARRNVADYATGEDVPTEEAERLVARVAEFIETMERILGPA